MTLVAESPIELATAALPAVFTPMAAEMAPVAAVTAPVAAELAPATHVQPSRWRKAGAAVTAVLTLASGACGTAREGYVDQRPAPLEFGIDPHLKAAEAGPLAVGVIIVRPEGSTDRPMGLTEQVVMDGTIDAEAGITAATNGKVTFQKPKYFGNHVLKVKNPKGACETDEKAMVGKEFADELKKGALDTARGEGYYDSANLALVMFVDAACGKFVHSFAAVDGKFQRGNVVYLASDPRENKYTIPHELLHEANVLHANQLVRNSAAVSNFGNVKNSNEYGNPRSVMGNPAFLYEGNRKGVEVNLNGYEMHALGALPDSEISVINQPAEYKVTISALDNPDGSGTKLVRIPRLGNPADGLHNWWVEFSRAPLSPDTAKHKAGRGTVPVTIPQQEYGVCVYAADDGNQKKSSATDLATIEYLNEVGIGCATKYDTGWTFFQDPESGVRVRLEGIDQQTKMATVTITYAGKRLPAMAAPSYFGPRG